MCSFLSSYIDNYCQAIPLSRLSCKNISNTKSKNDLLSL